MIWKIILEDFRVNRGGGILCMVTLAIYRLGNLVATRRSRFKMARLCLSFLRRALAVMYKVVQGISGSSMPFSTIIGRRMVLPHGFFGVFISADAVIGDDVVILHQVTIGSNYGSRKKRAAPRIGNKVLLGAGAKVIGGVSVGEGARIGVNAVITNDVPAETTVVCRNVEASLHGC